MALYTLQYCDRGPIGGEAPGRVVDLVAVYPDGTRLAVARYFGYQPKNESAHMVLYPRKIHRKSWLPGGCVDKVRIGISEIRR